MLEVWTATAGIVDGYFKGYIKDNNDIEFSFDDIQNCYIENSLKFDESSLQIIIENKEPFLIGDFCFDIKNSCYICHFDCSFKMPITVEVKDLEDIIDYNITKDMITIKKYNIIPSDIEDIESFDSACINWLLNADYKDVEFEIDPSCNPHLMNVLMKYITQLIEDEISRLYEEEPDNKEAIEELEEGLKKYPYTDLSAEEFREKYTKYVSDLDWWQPPFSEAIPDFEDAIYADIADTVKLQCEDFIQSKDIKNVILTINWQNETLDTSNADLVVLYKRPEIIY